MGAVAACPSGNCLGYHYFKGIKAKEFQSNFKIGTIGVMVHYLAVSLDHESRGPRNVCFNAGSMGEVVIDTFLFNFNLEIY